jgi:hypothetical protein
VTLDRLRITPLVVLVVAMIRDRRSLHNLLTKIQRNAALGPRRASALNGALYGAPDLRAFVLLKPQSLVKTSTGTSNT